MFKKIIYFLCTPYRIYKEKKDFKERMKKLRDRDPFIYK